MKPLVGILLLLVKADLNSFENFMREVRNSPKSFLFKPRMASSSRSIVVVTASDSMADVAIDVAAAPTSF